jgi:4'-phosphopantetheinyl transferase
MTMTLPRNVRIARAEVAPLRGQAGNALASAAVEIASLPLDVDPASVRALTDLLSTDETERASRFVFERDRRRFIVARASLRQLLAARLGVRPQAVEFSYGLRGKPALAPRFSASDLRFNLSHSGSLAVVALADGCELGVDVEEVRALPDATDVAARFFSRRENEAYLALEARDRPQGFFNCWTRKEAFIKALGDGLYHPLDRFDVTLAPGEPAKILRVEDTPGERCGWTLHSFTPGPGFVGAVAVRSQA